MHDCNTSRIRVRRFAALLFLVAACDGTPAERVPNAGDAIVIGAAWPWEARREILYWQGMELALEEVNAGGGIRGRPLRVLREDDAESVNEGRLVARELATNPAVVAVVGHLQSFVSIAAAPIYDMAGVVLVAPTSTSPQLTALGYSRVFRTTFTDLEVGQQMADFGRRQGYRRYVIYYARNEYGRGLANAFEERVVTTGGRVVDRQSYDPNLSSNPRAAERTVRGWLTRDFDAVFIAGEDEQAGQLVAALRHQGIHAPILGSDALATPTYLETAGPAAEGTVVATAFHEDAPNTAAREFTEAFRARYGTSPDVGAALGYDAIRILAHALRQAPSPRPEHIAAALRSLQDWPGVTGPMTFDEAGNLVGMPVHKVIVRNGRFEYLEDARVAAQR